MANQWFKFYGTEYLSDTKIANLTGNERSCWLTLLCLASSNSDLGTIKYLTEEVLLRKSGIEYNPSDPDEWNQCLGVLKKFEKMEMITLDDNGDICIKNWKKRQQRAMTGYERVKKYRENKRKNGVDNEMITNDNGNDNARIEENRIDKNNIVDEKSSTTEKIVKFTQVDLDLSRLLFEQIKANTPTFKEPNIDSWASHIRLMRERDNRTEKQIEFVIKWCQKDNFWQANILSTKKLREKFDQLVAQIKRQADRNKINSSNIAF